MKLRLTYDPARFRAGLKRWGTVAFWLAGGGGLVLFVFGVSFYIAMRVEMSSTEVRVPDLRGRTLEECSAAVEEFELVLEVVDQRNDPAIASGHVLQQSPPPKASVRRGRKIKLILSLGGKVLEVPDLLGNAARAVEIELRQGGFVPGDEARVPSSLAAAGRVIAQVPPPSTPAVPNSRVHRLVSDGPPSPTWVMPDLTGLTRKDAENWIARSDFRRGHVRRVSMSDRPSGTVVGQLPLAGYPIRTQDVVELTVAQ